MQVMQRCYIIRNYKLYTIKDVHEAYCLNTVTLKKNNDSINKFNVKYPFHDGQVKASHIFKFQFRQHSHLYVQHPFPGWASHFYSILCKM
jgi:hypothetical protein